MCQSGSPSQELLILCVKIWPVFWLQCLQNMKAHSETSLHITGFQMVWHPGLSLQCKKKTSDIKELVHLKGEDYTLSSVREREHVWFNELFKQEKSCCLIRIKWRHRVKGTTQKNPPLIGLWSMCNHKAQHSNKNKDELQNCLLSVATWILKMLSYAMDDSNADVAWDSQRTGKVMQK